MNLIFPNRLFQAFYHLVLAQLIWFFQVIFVNLRFPRKLSKIGNCCKLSSIFLVTAVILVVTACYSLQHQQNQTNSTNTRPLIGTRIVHHALGEVRIPVNPQRVVVIHDLLVLDPVLALGVKPIGVTYWAYGGNQGFRGIPSALVADIPEVGNISQPSIEAILSLKPDLILGISSQKNYYNQLSKIAPTVLLNTSEMSDFKERFRYIAQILGKGDRAEEVLLHYQERIQQLQQQLGEKLEQITISIIALEGKKLNTSNPDRAAVSQVIRDVGLCRPPIQQNQKEPYLTSSIEMLPQHDADVLFVMTHWMEENFDFISFLKQPIWSQLQAVQNNQAYEVEWVIGGPLGADHVIDDLFKYLVEKL